MIDSTYYPQPKRALSPGVILSFCLHIALVALFLFKTTFFNREQLAYDTAVRVDLVALPDKVQPNLAEPNQPEQKPEPATAPTPAQTPKPEPVVEKKPEPLPKKQTADQDAIKLQKDIKKKQNSALDKLKAMEALEKIKEDVKKDQVKTKANTPVKGNIINPGTSLTGLNKVQEQSYLNRLDSHIKSHWALPQWLANKNYRAQIRVQFDETGRIVSRQVIKSSGNATYDEMALATIDKSAPFPAPPEKFTAIFKVDGVLIGFPE